ncbi:RNA polymerase sigma factor [Neobacillus sp. WH10]|uniref:RNA polymerase sigma factor n=1 Tax=Neobacillus sp. WH10 TaxID=3047873 RepID=UPI0024C13C0B|nr:RNA polymerase sigma factor [Neobacillus sp. WH10]WHY78589.1 RNA polymerase sigma factor [Neobacillus sp. WH10]
MNKEQNLMDRIRKGDEEAFSLLVEELLSAAFKTAYLILRSKDLAEDAVQNALEDCYISIMKNKDIRKFKAWFYRLVYSRAIDIYRKNTRIHSTDIEENPEALAKMISESAQNRAIRNENMNEMLDFILSLPKEQSVPILLHYYEDLPIKEISLILDENSNTIKTRLARGRKRLGELIQKNDKYPLEVNSHGI